MLQSIGLSQHKILFIYRLPGQNLDRLTGPDFSVKLTGKSKESHERRTVDLIVLTKKRENLAHHPSNLRFETRTATLHHSKNPGSGGSGGSGDHSRSDFFCSALQKRPVQEPSAR